MVETIKAIVAKFMEALNALLAIFGKDAVETPDTSEYEEVIGGWYDTVVNG